MRSLVPTTRTDDTGTYAGAPLQRLAWGPDRLFDRLLGDFWGGAPTPPEAAYGALDVVELDDTIRVSVEVPGIDPKDLEVHLTGQVLTLSAEKRDEHHEESAQRTYSERRYGSFLRAIKLPSSVDAERVSAEHRNGVVTVTLQKSDAVRSKRIEVDAK